MAENAAVEFKAADEFRHLSKEKRRRRLDDRMDHLYQTMAFALQILALDKQELMNKVAQEYDLFGPLLIQLSDASNLVHAGREEEARRRVWLRHG